MNTWVAIYNDAGNIIQWINTNNVARVTYHTPNKCLVYTTDKNSFHVDISIEEFRKAALAAE
jgi:hypothetical protein